MKRIPPVRRPPVARAAVAPPSRVGLQWLLMAALALLVGALTLARAWGADQPVQLHVKAVKVKAGATVSVPVVVTVEKGWHVYGSPAPAEGVRVMQLALTSANGVQAKAAKLPPARRVHFAVLKQDANVYEGTVKVIVPIVVAKGVKPGHHVLAGVLRYQACSDNRCLFPKKQSFTVPVEVVK